MATAPKQLDQDQQALRARFHDLVNEHPVEIAEKYLQHFGPTLFHRLACELSINYSQSDKNRGYYYPALHDPAERILLEVLKLLLSRPTKGLPILLIAGAGPGAGKLTATLNPLLALRKEILCSYDVSNYTLENLQELINQVHGLNIPTIVAYIERPPSFSAQAIIIKTLNQELTPNPRAFAAAHVQNYQTFTQLISRYKKRDPLFASTVILNAGRPDSIYSTKASFLTDFPITTADAERAFNDQLAQLLNDNRVSNYNPGPTPRLSQIPRAGKTLLGQSTRIGYLLAQNLRANLIKLERNALRAPALDQAPSQTAPTTKNLIHSRLSATKDDLIKISNTAGQTLKGQERSLDSERPSRTVVQETSNRMHEMTTLLIR
jgi:hypothetical protein